MIDQDELVAVLQKIRGDTIVIPTMSVARPWNDSSDRPARDVPVSGAMGKASSFALGVALAQPDTRVIVLDGDGSLSMNLGSLATIAGKAPKNLFHFLLHNGVYAVTGGQPIPNADHVSFTEMAKGAGYASVYEFDDLEDFTIQIEEVFKQEGPVFVTIKSIPDIQNEPIGRRARPARPRTLISAMTELRQELGIE
jgi:thiamine pyrophosphate-dependent acetolactate synthase large subunit-like protein